MKKRDLLRAAFEKQSGVFNSDSISGFLRGIVESSDDPLGKGRVKVRVPSLHGHPQLYENLKWAEPILGHREFTVPKKYDRVWVAFENADKDYPLWIGSWIAAPIGAGNSENPHEERTGNEVPREGWTSNARDPEAQVLGRSREGNAVWFEDMAAGGDFIGTTYTENTGGLFLKMRTIHPGKSTYSAEQFNSTRHRLGDISGQKSEIKAKSVIGLGDSISEHAQRTFKNKENIIQNIQRDQSGEINEVVQSCSFNKQRSGTLGGAEHVITTHKNSLALKGKNYTVDISDRTMNLPEEW